MYPWLLRLTPGGGGGGGGGGVLPHRSYIGLFTASKGTVFVIRWPQVGCVRVSFRTNLFFSNIDVIRNHSWVACTNLRGLK